MARRALIPAAVATSTVEATSLIDDSYPSGPSVSHPTERRTSYGALVTQPAASHPYNDNEEDEEGNDLEQNQAQDNDGPLDLEYEALNGHTPIYDCE